MIPAEWSKALATVQEVYHPAAVIHGGAIRDFKLGLPANDLDIAVPYVERDLPFLDDLRDSLPRSWKYRRGSFRKNEYKQGVYELHEVENFKVDGLFLPVQIITYRYAVPWFGMHVINHNDFGMNQVGYDGNRIFWSHRFKEDMAAKQFTHVCCHYKYQAANAITRAARWARSGKYPGFKFDTKLGESMVMEDVSVS
jgi:hypothetical protein